MSTGRTIGTILGGAGGFALGGPGGATLGASAGSALGGLVDPDEDKEAVKNPRLAALLAVLEERANESPYESDGYQATMGQAREDAGDAAQDDAARAGVLGISPGMAVASGAGQRGNALARTTRGAAITAEQSQRSSQSALMQALGLDMAEDRQMEDRDERQRFRRNRALATLAEGALPYLLDRGLKPDSIYNP
ncbi:MAG: hypothetical protein Rubg2KO_15530 [Rubricoccaceae bacterium]